MIYVSKVESGQSLPSSSSPTHHQIHSFSPSPQLVKATEMALTLKRQKVDDNGR